MHWNDKMYRVPERFTRSYRQKLYVGGAAVIVISLAAMAFWFFGPFGSKETDVKKIVSLGIQGKRQLDVGEKTVLRVGASFSDGSETDVTKNLEWHSSDDSVIAVSGDGQVEARKEGFADITVRYEGTASPVLALVVRGESRSTEAEDKQRAEEARRPQQEEAKSKEQRRPQGILPPREPQKQQETQRPTYATVRVFFATDRNRTSNGSPAEMFGFDRASLSYGTCAVSIPRHHRMGALEGPSVLRFEFRQDPERHIMLLSASLLDKGKYFADLSVRIKKSVKKDAFIFIHGYNVTFADAARRTAQMAYDLGFAGAPVFYSWPSQGSLLRYTVDEANNEWTQSNLKQFLDDFTSETDAENIFLIGHGMGNRALTRAFGQLITEKPALRNRFREVILSAPDIDAEVFKRDIVPKIVPATLYASSTDEALTRSKKFRQYARAGDAGPGLVIVEGIDTIDATNVATDFLGRSYFAESRSVISDLFYLIKDGKRAQDRFGLVETNTAVGRYWVFKR